MEFLSAASLLNSLALQIILIMDKDLLFKLAFPLATLTVFNLILASYFVFRLDAVTFNMLENVIKTFDLKDGCEVISTVPTDMGDMVEES